VVAKDRVLDGRLRALQDNGFSRGALVHYKICRPSDYLVHSPKLAFLGQQATLSLMSRYRQTFPPENLGGSQTTKASTQAEVLQPSLGSGAESGRKNVIPPRLFCQDSGNGPEYVIELEWLPRFLIHRTGSISQVAPKCKNEPESIRWGNCKCPQEPLG
jgi:hypothetical protein